MMPRMGPGTSTGDPADEVEPDPTVPGSYSIRVLVADDHVLFRRGLEMVLAQEGDIDVVGEASDGSEAIERAEQLLPDVNLMDVRMPRTTGIEACLSIKERVPSSKIVMLTISDEESDLFEAVRAGANGYLLKDVPGEEIAAGIRAVHHGQSLISPSMASKLLAEFALISRRDADTPNPHAPKLTDREVRGAAPRRARQGQPRDRRRAVHLGEHREEPRAQHPREAPAAHPHEAAMYAVGRTSSTRGSTDPPVAAPPPPDA